MADLHDDDHLFEDVSPESPGTVGRNIVRRLGLASQVTKKYEYSQLRRVEVPVVDQKYYCNMCCSQLCTMFCFVPTEMY